jgi:hypothetical protein
MEYASRTMGTASEHVIAINRSLQESVEIGATTLGMLHEQGEQIEQSRNRVGPL